MIDATFVEWLKAPALYATAADAPGVARWGARAVTTEAIGPLALAADAAVEAARQAGFLSGPIVRDVHVVPGDRADLYLRPVTLRADRLGYEGEGRPVFVIKVVEGQTAGTSTLTVLRKL